MLADKRAIKGLTLLSKYLSARLNIYIHKYSIFFTKNFSIFTLC